MNFVEVLQDKKLLGQFIKDPATYRAWFCRHRAVRALPPEPGDMEIFQKCTGRTKWPTVPAKEVWDIMARRSGKSINAAFHCVYEAAFVKRELSAGETGCGILSAPTIQQAKVDKNYISGMFRENKLLRAMVVRETAWEIELKNGITIMVLAGDYRSIRGRTAVTIVLDEVSFFGVDGATTVAELLRAARPSLMTTGGMMVCSGSPFDTRGEQHKNWRMYYGKDDSDVMVWQADSLTMNPTLSREAIAKAYADDPEGAASEWGGEFRAEAESFFPMELLRECVKRGEGYHYFPEGGGADERYSCFIDPAGGSGSDSMVLAIAAVAPDGVRYVVHLEERTPPFSPLEVRTDFCQRVKGYGITTVTGDRYGGDWIPELFAAEGITYLPADRNKSELYLEMLALCNSGKVALPDNEKLIYQLSRLVRKHRSGRPSIDVPQHTSDDLANAICGALVLANNLQPSFTGRADLLLCDPPPITRIEREMDLVSSFAPQVRLSIREKMLREFDY